MNQQQHRSRIPIKRLFCLACIFTVIIFIYIVRLGWLQLIEGNRILPANKFTFMRQSIIQREQAIELNSGRGSIVDRNGNIYAGKPITALVLFPLYQYERSPVVTKLLAKWLHTTEQELIERWQHAMTPYIWPLRENVKLPQPLTKQQAIFLQRAACPGVYALPYIIRYPLRQHTPQWIGAIATMKQQISSQFSPGYGEGQDIDNRSHIMGVSGLERTFEPLLRGIGPTTLVHYIDAKKRPLAGLHLRMRRPNNRYYPLRLVTTTEQKIETAIGQVLHRHQLKKGSVVVLDANTRDVVAMITRPQADPYHIIPQQHAWNNRAIKALPPGSIYKMMIAATALETGNVHPNERFYCHGSYGKYGLRCWLAKGHGWLTLRAAFSHSCNVVFAELSERLGAHVLSSFALKLGFSGTVGLISTGQIGPYKLQHFAGEEKGQVFASTQPVDGGTLAQVGIGQRDVRLTPLAAANFIVTLLQDGVGGKPRLVQRVDYATGMPFIHLRPQTKQKRVIKTKTAKIVKQMLRDTVRYGTGKALQQSIWKVAGKSGTAQAAAYGTAHVHTWFAGYGPIQDPIYAVTVVSEDEQTPSAHKATAIFRDVMNVLATYHIQNQ